MRRCAPSARPSEKYYIKREKDKKDAPIDGGGGGDGEAARSSAHELHGVPQENERDITSTKRAKWASQPTISECVHNRGYVGGYAVPGDLLMEEDAKDMLSQQPTDESDWGGLFGDKMWRDADSSPTSSRRFSYSLDIANAAVARVLNEMSRTLISPTCRSKGLFPHYTMGMITS